jgi:hypothetical protein
LRAFPYENDLLREKFSSSFLRRYRRGSLALLFPLRQGFFVMKLVEFVGFSVEMEAGKN